MRIAVSLPALAQRVTVFGSTRNIEATSAGVSKTSASLDRFKLKLILVSIGSSRNVHFANFEQRVVAGEGDFQVAELHGLF